ncbi:uncharacterized protein LOC106398509 [Brassica napus]|nr:uncharacterized protein LOC106398509 [Brassica napus]
MGRLIDITGELGISYLGVSKSATLAEATATTAGTFGDVDRDDTPTCDDFEPYFSATKTWNYLRIKKTKLPWHSIVWFPQAIPRQSFMVWLAFKDRLSTGTRMKEWGMEQCCVYCREKDESRDHLFFACPYTFTVWMNVAEKLLGPEITPDWEDTVTSLLRQNRNRLDAILLRLVFQTAIYVLWKERNSRRHGGVCAPVDTTTKAIGNIVKKRISSLKYMGNHKLRGLLVKWFTMYTY